MRYLMMSNTADNEPNETVQAEMAKFIQDTAAAGILVTAGGLGPNPTRLTRSGDQVTVTDGPFAEAKEEVGGFALVDVRSKEEAIEIGRRFLAIAGDGTSVIQQVFGPEE